jgi:hypothetical protein
MSRPRRDLDVDGTKQNRTRVNARAATTIASNEYLGSRPPERTPAAANVPQGGCVKKASEYRQHAEECRTLAKGMPEGDARDQLLTMAETWERLAQDRDAAASVGAEEARLEPKPDGLSRVQ